VKSALEQSYNFQMRNRNTVEFLVIRELVYNPSFNDGEFAIIKSQAGLTDFMC